MTRPVPVPRPDPSASVSRLGRAGLFSILTVCLAVAGHRLAGGAAVSAPAMAVAAMVAMVAGWFGTRRERSRRFLISVTVATQLFGHCLFVVSGVLRAASGSSPRLSDNALRLLLFCHHGPGTITAEQVRQASRGLDLSAVAPHTAHTAGGGALTAGVGAIALTGLPMLIAHLCAAGVVGWWLHCGESAVWRAARRFVEAVTCPWSPAPRLRYPLLLVPHPAAAPMVPTHCRPILRRGPPDRSLTLVLSSEV